MIRQLLGIAGILLAVLGLAYDVRWLIWGAMGVLSLSFGWRLVERRRQARAREESGN